MAQPTSQVTSAMHDTRIDREKTCPLLLRIFCSNGRHNPLSEYSRGSVPANELQIYTWLDCSLRELTSLIKEVNPDARKRGTTFDFSVISPERFNGRYGAREIGNTMNGTRGVDDNKTLAQCRFDIGDFIDVAVTLPQFRVNDRRPVGRDYFGARGDNFGGPSRGGYRQSFDAR